jgi:predicted small integral membrane protein
MAVERTPEELDATECERIYITGVLEEAIADFASYFAADAMGEGPEVCEMWVNRAWNGLRENLSDEQQLAAIVLLLTESAREAAVGIVCGVASTVEGADR